jgi:hypothetical protein
MATGRAILAAVDGDAAEVLRHAEAGMTRNPRDDGAPADATRLHAATSHEEKTLSVGEVTKRHFTVTCENDRLG